MIYEVYGECTIRQIHYLVISAKPVADGFLRGAVMMKQFVIAAALSIMFNMKQIAKRVKAAAGK